MTKEQMLVEVQTMLDDDTLTPATRLNDIERWDSLSAISFLALMKRSLNASTTADKVQAAATVGDLLALGEGHYE